jgi:hypothetical protein
MTASAGLLFGIYPGGATGDDTGGLARGPADDPERIRAAIGKLRPGGRPFLVRGYVSFVDSDDTREITEAPDGVERYAGDGRVLDLVAQYQSHRGDVAGYTGFVRRLVRDHGRSTATLQITEEPNVAGNPTLDGYYPNVRDALVGHITENGWPTFGDRTPERQAEVLEATVTAIAGCRSELAIGAYTHFALRDADSDAPGLFHHFGLLTDDYRPKPAFTTYQALIERFGR